MIVIAAVGCGTNDLNSATHAQVSSAGSFGNATAGTGVHASAGTGTPASSSPAAGSAANSGTTSTLIPTAGMPASPANAGQAGGPTLAGGAGAPADAGASGAGALAGAVADAGASGMTGAGGTAAPSGGFIREDAPTEASAKTKGKFTVKTYTSGFSGAGQDFGGATIYYPTDAEAPFASVAVVPGFTAFQNSIADWGPFLASHGIVTMTIDTLTTADPPAQRATELMGALKSLIGENTRDGSPLMGKLATDRQAVSGWSMGGGGTLIAASMQASLKCAVSFAAWGPSGGAMDMVPALMFEGTVDPLAAGMSEPYYQQVPDSVPKMLFEVNGAGHDVANSPNNSMGIIGLYGLSWFKVFLEGDDRYKQFLLAPKPSITNTFETNLK